MKKIETQEDLEKKSKRNKAIGGIVLIALMVFSSAGFALYGTSGTATPIDNPNPFYNGQYWQYDLGGQQFYLTSNLEEASKIEINTDKTLQSYSGLDLYVDSDSEEITNLIGLNLGRYAKRFQEACYGECEEDLPEKDCTENMIIFRLSDQARVYQDQNCVFIEGNSQSADAFIYRILGAI